MERRSFFTVLSFALLVLGMTLSTCPIYAQFTSGFVGTVTDQSGATVPNAKITIINQATNVPSLTVSGSSGDFRVAALAGGTYRAEVEAQGFQPWAQSDILLEYNEVKTLYPVLRLGAQKTTVEVKAAAAVVTAVSDTSRQLEKETIKSMPLLGRGIYSGLLELAPGITGTGELYGGATGSGSVSEDSFEVEPGFRVNAPGQRQENNEYQIDGSFMNSASHGGVVNSSPEADFIEAMRISSANFSASKGRLSGALIQIFTRAGDNQFHGSLSEFHADNALTSRTIFQTCSPGATGCHAVPVFRRNEFGGSIGGPIIKNKLFFFGGLFVLRSANANTIVTPVETPQFAQWVANNYPNGIATKFLTEGPPASAPVNGFLTAAQVETITPGFYAPPSSLPANMPIVGTGYFNQSPAHNAYQWHVRGDYNFNHDKDRIFLDWFDDWTNTIGADARPLFRVGTPNHAVLAKLDWTHSFTATLLNEASFNTGNADGDNPGTNHKELPNVGIGGIWGFNQWGPNGWVHDNYNWHDALTWTHNRHTIEAGFDVDRHHDDDNFTNGIVHPFFWFINMLDFAQDLPFLQSGPVVTANGQPASNLYEAARWLYAGGFVQDDWKVKPRFTLNLGVRYDYFGHWGNMHTTGVPFPWFTPGSGSTPAEQIASGVLQVRGGSKAYTVNNTPNYFVPRIGFGWDVFGDGKMAVRGGYGLYYNEVADNSWESQVRVSPPTWATPNFTVFNKQPFSYGLGDSSGLVWPAPPGIHYQVNSAGGFVGISTTVHGMVPTLDQPRTQNWMFSIQRELRKDLILEADYNGSHSDHQFVQTDVNRFNGDLVVNKGTLTRLNPNFGTILYGRTIGTADGNYGSLMLTKRYSHSWQLRGIFTYGRDTDDLSSDDNGTDNGEAVYDPTNLSAQHGRSDYDIRKRFTLDSVWEIPTPFRSGFAKAVLGDWRMSHILMLQSGRPFTVVKGGAFVPVFDASGNVIANRGGDYNADGYALDRPDTPSFGNYKSTNRSSFITGFAPASAFPAPALGQEGNLGRNTFTGPGTANLNTEFAKAARIPWFTKEGANLEFRVDIFNLFNRVNLINPTSDLSSYLFGRSTGQNLTRSAQFGIHIRY